MASKQKYYVVWKGKEPGIYDSWPKCQAQVSGIKGAKYKSFKTKAEAVAAFNQSAEAYFAQDKTAKPHLDFLSSEEMAKIDWSAITVDAACSGNPGKMEYRGVWTQTLKQEFKSQVYHGGTNNIGEFLGIVHALALFKKQGLRTNIYTDSRTAMAWVRNKKTKTTLKMTQKNQLIFEHLERAIAWLESNSYENQILKWNTKNWGEIPADFGRK